MNIIISVRRFFFLLSADVLGCRGLYMPRPDAVYADPGRLLLAANSDITAADLLALRSSRVLA